MNETNLRKLAIALLFKRQADFDMGQYRSVKNKSGLIYHLRTILFGSTQIGAGPCDTTACALGSAIDVPGLEPILADKNETGFGIEWEKYCQRVFGIVPGSLEGKWIFSPYWKYIDNSPRGAAARIMYLLKRNIVPYPFSEAIWPEHIEGMGGLHIGEPEFREREWMRNKLLRSCVPVYKNYEKLITKAMKKCK